MDELRMYDISRTVGEETAVWPGDTPFSRQWVMAISRGDSCNTSTLTLSAHTATHTDAPCHFVEGAAGMDEVDLWAYLGRCRVKYAAHADCIRPSDILGLDLAREERLLFKTQNAPSDEVWRDDFAYVSTDVARAAAAAGLRLLGLDTPSVDPMHSKTLDAHKILLGGGVAILESADLEDVPEGIYELVALPLKIRSGDSSPVRAILRPWKGE